MPRYYLLSSDWWILSKNKWITCFFITSGNVWHTKPFLTWSVSPMSSSGLLIVWRRTSCSGFFVAMCYGKGSNRLFLWTQQKSNSRGRFLCSEFPATFLPALSPKSSLCPSCSWFFFSSGPHALYLFCLFLGDWAHKLTSILSECIGQLQ